jgi:hypothetical protein
MPDFSTNMSEWSGGYASAPVVNKAPRTDSWGDMAARLVPTVLEAVGKGYAEGRGASILGGDTTAEEAQNAVESFSEAVPFSDDPSNTPDQKARIDDMKTEALKKFGTNDKKIQALVSAGKISSLEANARRHQMIQENLSNPVLAMFKSEFMDASAAFTGGPGLTEQYFGAYMPTEEEKATLAASEMIVKERAKTETTIQQLVMTAGVSREQAIGILQEQSSKANKLAEAEYTSKMRGYTSQESFVAGMSVVDNFMQEAGGQIAQIAAAGKKLGDTDMQQLKGQLAQSFQINMAKLQQFGKTMTSEDYNKVRTELEGQYKNMDALINDSDSYKFYERMVGRTKLHNESVIGKAYAEMASKAPYVLAAYKISPQLGDMWVASMGDDLSAKMALKTHPFFKNFLPELGYTDLQAASSDAVQKIAENDSENWSFGSALTWVKNLVTPGRVAGATAAVNESPDAYRAAFSTAFSNQKVSLQNLSDSDEFVANSRTPDGAKVAAMAIVEKMKQIRGLQMVNKEKIPSDIKIRIPMPAGDMPPMVGGIKYEFNTSDLDPTVQRELVQAYKILMRSPAVVKELGVNSPDEFIQKALTYK